jgi:pimeloyl-ACP methyl ester carboxylesterase
MTRGWRPPAPLVLAALGAGLHPPVARADVPALTVTGTGPLAVFETGLGMRPDTWARIAPTLSRCLTLVTYDRYAGPPPGPDASPILAATVAETLHAALRARGLMPPYLLVGHSLGGLYVQAFARAFPRDVAGLVLIDGASPLEPPGVFASRMPPRPGSRAAAEEDGVAPSSAAMRSGPPLPPVPLVVLAATDHATSGELEALWQDVQRRTAALSPQGRLEVVQSGHVIQDDRPQAVIDAVLSVAQAAGADVSACRR